MQRIVIVYGLIAGFIASVLLSLWMYFFHQGIVNLDNGELVGYGSMIIALSMVFFGVRSYRDNQNGGVISFWKGVKVGLLISLIAAVVYAVGWEIYMLISPDTVNRFFDSYTEHALNKLREGGATPEEMERTIHEMAGFREMYKNPLIRLGMTMVEILPVGVVVTFVSAALLRKKEMLPSPERVTSG
ncbi:MAG TPA: DUF4199 domain-containing protein [Pyrinomonadaceae bacterium]